ncbi:hypothetical protein HV284_24795 (plasmid) [Escherichia marmotae]|uniref:Lipoprotein n=1 Tax=Escherichia marmotae TaxID=1499973 RepID=A0A7H9KEV5_9ESCH|nr:MULTISPECIES: putative T6SS immunity periplasmic lipoprotein [Escherichia]MBE8563609.1 hypothetical protein [Escherichia coli]MDQ9311086.1 hypothetical protein [Escherichia marmotae]MEC9862184.1 hypothetical protein [Escherichia coli]MED0217856.1 hypothetical protein [Escherichia coli]MED9197919.1 hypothetical protein [Escherichia marmotae]
MNIQKILSLLLPLFLMGCGAGDRLQFYDIGSAFIENGKLCIGTKERTDVLSYYMIERFGEGLGSKHDGVLVSSGYESVSITYPDTCVNVNLISGDNIHYHIAYILNGRKYRYDFDYLSNGSISPLNK